MDDLLNNAPCGFGTIAEDGTFLMVNGTLLSMLGYDLTELQGRHIQTILSVGARVFYQTHFFPTLKLQGKIEEIYLALKAKSGEEVPVLVNAERRERHGATVTDCIFVAMHQRSRYEDAILQARKTAQVAVEAKEVAYAELAKVNEELEEANLELEAQQKALRTQQDHLLELNAQLHARMERELLVNQIGHAIRQEKEPGQILTTAVTSLGMLLKADRCYFAEYNTASDWARVSTDWHRPDLPSLRGVYRISDFDLNIAEVYGADGLFQSEDIHVTNELFSPKAMAALAELELRSGIGVAIFEARVPVASFNVAMADSPRAWTKEDIELVQAVMTLTRSAVQEARFHEREHRIAEQLQEALQPKLPNNLPGLTLSAYYRPALDEAEIGGDFYDVFALEKGCYAIVVADLSGKGLQAAAQIATVRHMLRASLYQPGVTLSQAITSLHEMLIEHELLNGFATLFVGAYDVNQRTLTYVNAGQESGLIRRESGNIIEEMEPTGPILGGFPGAIFQQRTVSLSSGDVIALFTDGLTEAGCNRKDLLGVSGVARIFRESVSSDSRHLGSVVNPQEITSRIMQSIEIEATPAGIRDDVCLLVACVE